MISITCRFKFWDGLFTSIKTVFMIAPEKLFTQAGRIFNFNFRDKKVACNYYFSRSNANSPSNKLWMNILFHVGERKDLYELTIEQPETALLLKPKKILDDKVQRLVECYLINLT